MAHADFDVVTGPWTPGRRISPPIGSAPLKAAGHRKQAALADLARAGTSIGQSHREEPRAAEGLSVVTAGT